VLSGLWWNVSGGRDAKFMVSNTSGNSVTADVFLDFLGQHQTSTPLSFIPHETKVLSLTQMLADLNVSASSAPQGGITIIQRGATPSLIAQGKILDPATGFSTTLDFPLPQVQNVSALHASGVPIGAPTSDSAFANTGTFLPHVIVRNLLASPQSVMITAEYPGAKATEQIALAPISVAAYSTVDQPLDYVLNELSAAVPYCSIRIQYSGPPGSVMAQVSSVEQKSDMVIDSRLANEGDGWAGSGGHPWHLDGQTDSVLFLTDMGDQSAHIGLQIHASGVQYNVINVLLNAHETRAINIRQLRDAQKPDLYGNVLPAGATDGSVLWVRADNVPVMGRLVVMQTNGGTASSYDCTLCQCPLRVTGTTLATSPATYTLAPELTQQVSAVATEADCYGNNYPVDVTSSSSWNSGNTAVATMSGGGLATGVGAGSTSTNGSYSGCGAWSLNGQSCYCNSPVHENGSSSATTRVPKYAVLRSDSGLVNSSICLMTQGAKEDDRDYLAYDDYGEITLRHNWTLNEKVTSTSNCGVTTDGSKKNSEDFLDGISVCQTGCTLKTQQTFTIDGTNVMAKDCPQTTCAAHTGWNVTATYNNVSVTDY
jgi:hypothetical protein